ncbi:hypothetical protein IG631_07563 [Alternaria alternata]|nr:hypothetical protein IG631_07563 [Alternaria alternata]
MAHAAKSVILSCRLSIVAPAIVAQAPSSRATRFGPVACCNLPSLSLAYCQALVVLLLARVAFTLHHQHHELHLSNAPLLASKLPRPPDQSASPTNSASTPPNN